MLNANYVFNKIIIKYMLITLIINNTIYNHQKKIII